MKTNLLLAKQPQVFLTESRKGTSSIRIEQATTQAVYKHAKNPPHFFQHLVMCWSVLQQPYQVGRRNAGRAQLWSRTAPDYRRIVNAGGVSQWWRINLKGGRSWVPSILPLRGKVWSQFNSIIIARCTTISRPLKTHGVCERSDDCSRW